MQKMKRSRAVALLAAGLLTPPLSSRAQGTAPYKIGATFPLTGPFAPISSEFLKGASIAVDDVNAAGGVNGRQLLLVAEDSQASPQAGIAAMRKLAQVDGVQAILSAFTNVVVAQIPLADEIKVPAMGGIETPGLFTKSEYMFSHAPTWDKGLPFMAAYWKAHNLTRLFGMLTNNSLGAAQSPRLRAIAAEIGGTYDEALLDPNATDYRGVIERARTANAQVLLFSGQGSTIEAQAIKQARELGIDAQIWCITNGYTGKSFRDAIGPYAEGLVLGGLNLDPNNPATNPFARKYRAALGFIPAYPTGEIYDIIKIYAYAIRKAGYTGEAIKNVVATLKGVPSVLGGTITMGSDHYTQFTITGLWQVKAGKLVRL
jgi:branched-chain amino acid transport system substrate-binding protein